MLNYQRVALSQMPKIQRNTVSTPTAQPPDIHNPRYLWTLGNSFWPGMASWAMAL